MSLFLLVSFADAQGMVPREPLGYDENTGKSITIGGSIEGNNEDEDTDAQRAPASKNSEKAVRPQNQQSNIENIEDKVKFEGTAESIRKVFKDSPPTRKTMMSEEGSIKGIDTLYMYEEKLRESGYRGNNALYSDKLRSCEINLPEGTKWPSAVESHGKRIGSARLWEPTIKAMLAEESIQLLTKSGGIGKTFDSVGDFKQAIENADSSKPGIRRNIIAFLNYIQTCQGLLFSTTHSDFNAGNYDDKVSAVNPELKCMAKHGETQDYKTCTRLLKVHDGFYLAKQANTTVQAVRSELHAEGVQEKTINKIDEGGSQVKSTLEGQKDLISKQKQLAQERMVLSATEAAAIETARRAMPTTSDLAKQCVSGLGDWRNRYKEMVKSNLDKLMSEIGGKVKFCPKGSQCFDRGIPEFSPDEINSRLSGPEDICAEIFAANYEGDGLPGVSGLNLILNTKTRQLAAAVTMKAAVDAAAELARAKILGDRAKQIKGAIKDIDEFEPTTPTGTFATGNPCEINPLLPGCVGIASGGRQRVTLLDSNFNIGGGAGSSNVGDAQNGKEGEGAQAGDPDKAKHDGPIISDINDGRTRRSGFSGDPPNAARVGKGSGNPSGSGGPNVGGAGPGSGTGSKSMGSSGQNSNAVTSIKDRRTGGSGLKGKWRGGKRRRKPSSKDNANPLAGLLGKKGKGASSGVLNVGKVGNKKSDLFEMISQRYQKMVKEERLNSQTKLH